MYSEGDERGIVCSVCQQQKQTLKKKKSELLPGDLFLCGRCWQGKFEPRFAIILTARMKGAKYVEKYISPKRYVGKDILLGEVLGDKE